MDLLTPQKAQGRWPLMNVDDVVGAAFMPMDGQANPSGITQALAKGARMNGAQIVENCKVTDIETDKGVIRVAITNQGRVERGQAVLPGHETIYRKGERAGWLSSDEFGYTIDKSIGYIYVRQNKGVDWDFVLDGSYEQEVPTERVPCSVHIGPLYDPQMRCMKC